MVTLSVPTQSVSVLFSVDTGGVLLAGSRNLVVPPGLHPKASLHYQVYASDLFGVSGFWVFPHPSDEGTCDDPY